MLSNSKIAVVVPAYKVAAQIGRVLAAMPECVDAIIVVDDCSPDDLAERVKAIADPRVLLIRHSVNQGVGGSTVSGIAEAIQRGFQIIVKCDGDGQMDPADIPKLVSPLISGQADYAKGSRFQHFRALRSMPKWRFAGNVGLTFLTKMASGYWNILDPVNGFLAMRSDVIAKLPLSRLSRRYFFETDLLIRLNVVQARVADVPIPARYGDESSSLSVTRVLFDFPLRLAAGLIRRIFWRYLFYDVSPVAVFGLLGTLLCGFGILFGAYQWVEHAMRGVNTPVGTVMIAAIPFILGFQLLLQAIVLDIENTPRPAPPTAKGNDAET
jgi:glycosyltransferase involved in cell wall biosynthesis